MLFESVAFFSRYELYPVTKKLSTFEKPHKQIVYNICQKDTFVFNLFPTKDMLFSLPEEYDIIGIKKSLYTKWSCIPLASTFWQERLFSFGHTFSDACWPLAICIKPDSEEALFPLFEFGWVKENLTKSDSVFLFIYYNKAAWYFVKRFFDGSVQYFPDADQRVISDDCAFLGADQEMIDSISLAANVFFEGYKKVIKGIVKRERWSLRFLYWPKKIKEINNLFKFKMEVSMALNLVGWNVVLDSDNADELSAFYERLLGWTRFPGEEFTTLANMGQGGFPTWITFQQVDDYTPPVWPATHAEQQQMAHLDFHVEDVEEGVRYAISCGAALSETQYDDGWRVMIDPAGHPFCLLPPLPWMKHQ